MSNSILMRDGDGEWTPPETSAYSNEDHLQGVLHAQPSLIPGVPRDAFAVREIPTSAGPIDVCTIDPDGAITVVECKLASNSERRRMVVGQVIDYASAIWSDGLDTFRSAWLSSAGIDLREALDESAFEQLERNVETPRIHLCLAVDKIDDDLRRLIEFLNRSTRDEISVIALQLSYARKSDVEILIPKTFGAELAQAKANARTRNEEKWTIDRYLESLEQPADQDAARWLFDRTADLETIGTFAPLWFGAYPNGGIFFQLHGLEYSPFQLWRNSAGRAMVFGNWRQFQAVTGHPGFEPLAAMLGQEISGSSRGVALADLNLEEFWSVALAAAHAINGR